MRLCVGARVRGFGPQQDCIGILFDLTATASGVESVEQVRTIPGFERTPLVLVTDVLVELKELALVDSLLLPWSYLLRNKIAMFLELRSSEERYRALLEHPTDFLFLLEAVRTAAGEIEDWRYVDANKNGIRLLDATRETLLGKRVSEVLPDRAERLIALCAKVLQTRSPHEYESCFGAAEFRTWCFPTVPTQSSLPAPTSPPETMLSARCSVWSKPSMRKRNGYSQL